MSWRVARALLALRDQCNRAWPIRSAVSDGTIGNAEHASRASDHNPWYGPGIVTAMDITHDPAHGADMRRLAAALVASRDKRIKYLIWDRRIASGAAGPTPWRWKPYSGANPHTHHMHISVVASGLCDDASPWRLPGATPVPTEETDLTPLQARQLAHVDEMLAKNNVVGKVDTLVADVAALRADLAALRADLTTTKTKK